MHHPVKFVFVLIQVNWFDAKQFEDKGLQIAGLRGD